MYKDAQSIWGQLSTRKSWNPQSIVTEPIELPFVGIINTFICIQSHQLAHSYTVEVLCSVPFAHTLLAACESAKNAIQLECKFKSFWSLSSQGLLRSLHLLRVQNTCRFKEAFNHRLGSYLEVLNDHYLAWAVMAHSSTNVALIISTMSVLLSSFLFESL